MDPRNSTQSRIQTPWKTADQRVAPPALMLAEERTMTPVMGSPPSRPETRFPAPWAESSLSRLERSPLCSLHAPLRRQFQLGKRELFRQVDPLDVHLRHEGEDGADDDGDQRSGDRPQAGPRQFLPEHQHADGHDAERRGRGTESA